MTRIIPIPAFRDNYIWALHNGDQAVVVDPGDAAPVLEWLKASNIQLQAILCTHRHHDHTGGIRELVQVYNVPVYGPQQEHIPELTHPVTEGDWINFQDLPSIQVLEIPGHTSGHVAYLSDEFIFCGDTLFGCGCGRIFDGTAEQLHHSLKRLASLPADTQVFCAHEYTEANIRFALLCEPGNQDLQQRQETTRLIRQTGQPSLPSTIDLEKATNPFLRCNQPEIAENVQRHTTQSDLKDNELAVFTALHAWRSAI